MGDFREHVKRLRLANNKWSEETSFWTDSKRDNGKQIFSEHGQSSDGRTYIVRKGILQKSDLILRVGEKWWITSIEDELPGFVTVKTAKVNIQTCHQDEDGPEFQAAICETYIQHAELMPQRENTQVLTLVAPKTVTIVPGHLVTVGDLVYEITAAWELGENQNEYQIQRVVDL